ncbi:N-6 DNA methylase [Nocardioides sp.]|uniref:N-6 DNA methylase n=1 Tax=Nocardioides sp. TaxID=35761 RepID=UPI0025DB462B|nr:N-6 DNA methylase [Nocardioides sp.]
MSNLGNFVWSIADQLRGVYRPNQYGNVILPMTILRRLDCILEPTRDQVRALAESESREEILDIKVRREFGLNFYNTSAYDLARLKKDPDGLRHNLIDYVSKFSSNIDVFERFGFENEITKLDEKNRLYILLCRFADIDLHPDTVTNAEMGDLFEELIRKFAEASNETAGEHFTPRDAIRLAVDLVFAEDGDALTEKGVVRTVYDPTVGTGGFLSVADEHLKSRNPDARLTLFGQEINDQSYAICKSDMIAKGQDPANIKLGDTLAEDLFAGRTFDYCLSNPPYGVDWKASHEDVVAEYERAGKDSRFPGGLPPTSDGQMLFLQHLATKMRPIEDGGGRAAIVLNGSPLFSGGAESGPSEIRRWLIESDMVEAIVSLPTNMFYNTGISTYIWLLDNTKQAARVGKIQLIDASDMYTKMSKSLGSKSRELPDSARETIMRLYDDLAESDHSKNLSNDEFGYWTITVERPLRLNFNCTPDRIKNALAAKSLKTLDLDTLGECLETFGLDTYFNREAFLKDLNPHLRDHGLVLTTPQRKALWQSLGEQDEKADICYDKHGDPEPDTSLRDTETIPFTYGGNTDGDDGRNITISAYVENEVLPYLPDAWVDHAKTKVGYEIPFARLFRPDPKSFDFHGTVDRFAESEAEATRLALAVREFASGFARLAREQSWPVVPLRRVVRIVNGGTPTPEDENWGGDVHWATPVDINNADGFLRATLRTVTEQGLGNARVLPPGSVLVSSRAPIGSVAVTEIATTFNQGCKGLVMTGGFLTAECLAYQLMASKGLLESLGQGTTFMEINSDKLASVPVVVPPPEYQDGAAFAECIASFHGARRLFESLTDQARVRRRGMDLLIGLGAAPDGGLGGA